MGFKKMLDKIDEIELDNKIILFVFLIIGMFFGMGYIGALIIPNWEGFLEMPWLYQLVSYSVIALICLDISFVVIITLKTAITNQVLSEKNNRLEAENVEFNTKVKELEKELTRLKRGG